MILLLCGMSGAGKTTLAVNVQKKLRQSAIPVEVLDADEYRSRLFSDLGYSREDRHTNVRRLGFLANKFAEHGIVTIISAINPYEAIRQELVDTYADVKVVHVDCCLAELQRRDTKGLYAAVTAGRMENLSGVNDPFEAPRHPDLYFDTRRQSVQECAESINAYLLRELRGRERLCA